MRFQICSSSPLRVIVLTEVTTSAKQPPYPLAFIKTAPNRVPGIPAANSSPDNPCFCAKRETIPVPAPPVTIIVLPLRTTEFLILVVQIVIPRIPLSLTKVLVPPPITVTGIFIAAAFCNTCFNSSIL